MKSSARRWFAAALALYVLWVAALTALAVTSASPPAPAKVPLGAAPASFETPNPPDGDREGAP